MKEKRGAVMLCQELNSLGGGGGGGGRPVNYIVPRKLFIDLGHCSSVSVQGGKLRSNMDQF